MVGPQPSAAHDRASERVREIARDWEPPDFGHVPDADAAIFLCAVDHKTGYSEPHEVEGEGPYEGSELMWMLGLKAAAEEPGSLTSKRLRYVSAGDVAEWFRADSEPIGDPERRAALWRDLASGLERDYGGSALELLAEAGGRLAGSGGLVERLRAYRAYSDPLAKKAFLFAKICERRGWLEVSDPEAWEVSADNVLMRLALRSGLVSPGPLDEVRAATRVTFKELAARAEIPPPVLDDMLWELGRNDPDLLGSAAGDLAEPPRDPASAWY
ncbi:MAG: hypothetical protein QOI31_1220 [Solirubrobacterales bacterium]|nr:hypothetical protein [Solirubrobacterales bacterium]